MMRGAPVRFLPIHQCDDFIIHRSRQRAGQADSIQVRSSDIVGQNGLCVPVLPNVESMIVDKHGSYMGTVGWGDPWPIENLYPDYIGYVTIISMTNGSHYSITTRVGKAIKYTYHDGDSTIDSGLVVFLAEDCVVDGVVMDKRSCFSSVSQISIRGKCISFKVVDCDPRI